jgi:hypothetical protein
MVLDTPIWGLGETMKFLGELDNFDTEILLRFLISTIVFCSSLSLVDSYKIYAKTKIGSSKQFKCLDKLWIKESNWNPKARLGSHYGIPQGRSIYLKTADPYEQIDWGLKYLKHRYSKDYACEALAHMNAKGYS